MRAEPHLERGSWRAFDSAPRGERRECVEERAMQRGRTPRSQGIARWYMLLPESRKIAVVVLSTIVVLTLVSLLLGPPNPAAAPPAVAHTLSKGE